MGIVDRLKGLLGYTKKEEEAIFLQTEKTGVKDHNTLSDYLRLTDTVLTKGVEYANSGYGRGIAVENSFSWAHARLKEDCGHYIETMRAFTENIPDDALNELIPSRREHLMFSMMFSLLEELFGDYNAVYLIELSPIEAWMVSFDTLKSLVALRSHKQPSPKTHPILKIHVQKSFVSNFTFMYVRNNYPSEYIRGVSTVFSGLEITQDVIEEWFPDMMNALSSHRPHVH